MTLGHDEVARPVAIMITTYRRTDLLGPLIRAVHNQAAASDRTIRIAIVDNDPDRSAALIAEAEHADYVHEPTPGIGAARKAAIDAASEDELVVMLDDDVFPEAQWLAALIDTWEQHRPTVVMGFVRYVWPEHASPWFAAGGFMRRNLHPTGTRLSALATGSVLVDPRELRRLGVNFDPSRGLNGGEDSLFGEAVVRAGGTIVACAESVARDVIPEDRATVAFVRRRTVAQGASLVSLGLRGATGPRGWVRRCAAAGGALVRLVVFGILHLLGRVRRDARQDAVSKRRFWFALGRLRGALGRTIAEYARPDS